jgi:hypothetical protein
MTRQQNNEIKDLCQLIAKEHLWRRKIIRKLYVAGQSLCFTLVLKPYFLASEVRYRTPLGQARRGLRARSRSRAATICPQVGNLGRDRNLFKSLQRGGDFLSSSPCC